MSTIFSAETVTRLRPDATIRVKAFKPGTTEEDGYITVQSTFMRFTRIYMSHDNEVN
jgi:hypothetical protein